MARLKSILVDISHVPTLIYPVTEFADDGSKLPDFLKSDTLGLIIANWLHS